jgi:hypothetical protein
LNLRFHLRRRSLDLFAGRVPVPKRDRPRNGENKNGLKRNGPPRNEPPKSEPAKISRCRNYLRLRKVPRYALQALAVVVAVAVGVDEVAAGANRPLLRRLHLPQ